MSSFESGSHPRAALKPTTLPHGIVEDGAGERITGTLNIKPVPSIELVSTASGTDHAHRNENPCPTVMFISMRITFYVIVLLVTIGFTLAACKFTNIWDPCEHFYINRTECTVTSYMKGMLYHTDCTEEHYCVLPGFESNVKRQGWSLHRPNKTTSETTEAPVIAS
ncbi:hypothetical protein Ocin01_08511 [Orchesella cincta]|uniref:Uncharacterized protein n=1 Tax=Orchesella cincta TaxID=48709 RepID=A0A1D2MZU4_ORCCI|nr:hypothetical protein Ocin01_08511 [Orchesella cincta]